MSVANWPRLIASMLFALALAFLLGVQSLSSASTRTAPELASSLFSANGLAREQFAFVTFTGLATEPDQITQAAQGAYPIALGAVYSDPLTPKAHAILAIAAQDQSTRREILDAAARLNRRDISLQGLLLQEHVTANDYPRTIETLDQILRVHPEQTREFFPLLAQALADEETVPLFAELLDNSSPWHERFLNFAVGQREALPNLAKLRPLIDNDNIGIDRKLIAGLAGTGDVAGAEKLYQMVSETSAGTRSQGELDWRADFPPFDWRLVDEPGFRAQQGQDAGELEISVRPGKGGIIAARLVNTPQPPFQVRISHRIAPADQLRDVRLQLICAGSTTPFFDERFSRQGDGFRIETVPAECEFLVLGLNARAWSGRSALSGKIESITISR